MAISKTKISQRMKKKTNSALAEAIFLAKKSGDLKLAAELSSPTRKQATVNVGRLNEVKKDSIIVPGAVLSSGEIKNGRKMKVYAIKFSKKAEEKLKKAGCGCEQIFNVLRSGGKVTGEFLR